MDVPKDCLYSRDHLWVRTEGNQAVIGVTEKFMEETGEAIFLDLPEIDDSLSVAAPFGIIESNRTVSDLTAPLTGEIVDVNFDLIKSPDVINEDPYGDGWLVRVEMDDFEQAELLMTPEDYEDYVVDLSPEEEE